MDARPVLTLITGPTRSGKSRFAEALATRCDRPVTYVATARNDPRDAEWSARIAAHRAQRPAHWTTLETAQSDADLATVIREASPHGVVLIESLGTWLGSLLSEPAPGEDVDTVALETMLRDRSRALVDAFAMTRAESIVVSEQTGWGIVPAYPSARIFSSVLGRLTTTIARMATHSYLIVSGFAIDLRATGHALDIEENL